MPITKSKQKLFLPLFVCLTLIALTACGGPMFLMRDETPSRIATPVYMLKRNIQTESFDLVAYERVRKRGKRHHLYRG